MRMWSRINWARLMGSKGEFNEKVFVGKAQLMAVSPSNPRIRM